MVNRSFTILITSVSFLLATIELVAQKSQTDDLQIIFDAIGLEFDSDVEFEIYESLLEYLHNPINLNTASYKQLQGLLVLSEFQIQQLLTHIKNYGPLYSIYELQGIEGFDTKTITSLLYFAEVKERSIYDDKLKGYVLGRTQRLMQKKSGFKSNGQMPVYMGSPYSALLKVRIEKPRKYDMGLSLENDPGEPIRWAPKFKWYGTGFQSAYFQLENKGIIKNIIVGDFIANWGQGLVFGGGFSMGKSRQTTSVHKKLSTGLIPYRSTMENGFMRGVGISLHSGSIRISTLISSKSIDANSNESGQITSLVTSGLHRSNLELSKRMKVSKKTAGLNINFNPPHSKFEAGISGAFTHYDQSFNPEERPENRFKYSGQTNFVSGAYAEYRHRNFILFGEGAMTDKRALGIIAGGLANLSHHIDAIVMFRKYAPDFISPYAANAFRESSQAQNEQGFYWGFRYSQSKKLMIGAYADIFNYPWLKRAVSSPSIGSDYMISLDYFPIENLKVRAYYRSKRKEKNYTNEIDVDPRIESHNRELLKLDAVLELSQKVSYSSGIWHSGSHISEEKNTGSLIYTGISYRGRNISLHFKTILTDAKDYDTRFYMYESDVLYAFSVPVYYGQNLRYYILLKSKLSPKLSCWVKWSNTNFRDREEIGSGLDQIHGHLKSEIKLQAIYKL
jgi:hypothetical protein